MGGGAFRPDELLRPTPFGFVALDGGGGSAAAATAAIAAAWREAKNCNSDELIIL